MKGIGYKIEWSSFPAGASVMEALNANAIDLGGAGDSAVMFALAGNFSLKIVAASRGEPASAAVIVLPESSLRSVRDLKGRKVGTVKGSNGHLLVLAALRANGLPLDAAQIVFLSPAEAQGALQGGAIDAWSTWDPFYAIAQKRIGARALVDGTGFFRGYGFTLATAEALASKATLIQDYRRRAQAAAQWALSNVDAYARLFAQETGLPVDIAKVYVRRIRLQPAALDATMLKDERVTVDLLLAAGVIPKAVDVAAAIAPGFAF